VQHARRHARRLLHQDGLSCLSGDAEILISELVTNAIEASRQQADASQVQLALLCDRTQLLIMVRDTSPEVPQPVQADAADDRGRGLLLGIRLGDAVAITGLGVVGLLASQLARLAGATLVIGIDRYREAGTRRARSAFRSVLEQPSRSGPLDAPRTVPSVALLTFRGDQIVGFAAGRGQGRAWWTALNGVSAARRNRANPACPATSRMAVSRPGAERVPAGLGAGAGDAQERGERVVNPAHRVEVVGQRVVG
jgi:anti-sigma regulatory factor (Ser/Thr protein kinase)